MLRKELTFKNLDGDEVTQVFYFNFTKEELVDLEIEGEGGSLTDFFNKIIEEENRQEVIRQTKKLVLMAYGERDPDGVHFNKKDAEGNPLSERFREHVAFSDIFVSLATDPEAQLEFMMGVLPSDMRADVLAQIQKDEKKANDAAISTTSTTQPAAEDGSVDPLGRTTPE